ncbi:TRAP transporter small permease [Albibacillus kandeliae]|uniref:TRAP transporter small permease n=1 Tax=Albibacillus kandeliae TaxID=2174228 RepID=UPI000D688234|nr:TRAP transporter small permease [Albibacillus kandeliae]
MKLIGRALAGLVSMASFISTISIVLMMLHVTADVTCRYLLNQPLPGTLTIVAHYYMIIVTFVALAVAEKQEAHITVEIVADMLPPFAQRLLGWLSFVLTSAVFTLLAWRGFEIAMGKTKIRASIEQGSDMIPVWQSYWAIPIGAGLIALVALYKLVTEVFGVKSALTHPLDDLEMLHE